MYWSNDDDIQNDMLEISTFYNPVAPEPSPEPSEIKKKLCGKPSIYEMDVQEDEPQQEQVIVLPGRGRLLHGRGVLIPGGHKITTNQQHMQTSEAIRQVSGFGYGNDLIEHAFKASNSEDERGPGKMKNLSFEPPSPRKINKNSNGKKSGNESDSSTSTSEEYITFSSRSNSSGCINGPDINSKIDFPDLK